MLTDIADDIIPQSANDSTLADRNISPNIPAKLPVVPVVKNTGITSALVFQVDSVEKTEAACGEQGDDWYRYILKNRTSTINGLRRGSYQYVCEYAAEYAEQLNARIVFNPSKWQPRGNKVARTP